MKIKKMHAYCGKTETEDGKDILENAVLEIEKGDSTEFVLCKEYYPDTQSWWHGTYCLCLQDALDIFDRQMKKLRPTARYFFNALIYADDEAETQKVSKYLNSVSYSYSTFVDYGLEIACEGEFYDDFMDDCYKNIEENLNGTDVNGKIQVICAEKLSKYTIILEDGKIDSYNEDDIFDSLLV
jgi:hypothetical protein